MQMNEIEPIKLNEKVKPCPAKITFGIKVKLQNFMLENIFILTFSAMRLKLRKLSTNSQPVAIYSTFIKFMSYRQSFLSSVHLNNTTIAEVPICTCFLLFVCKSRNLAPATFHGRFCELSSQRKTQKVRSRI